MQGCVHIYCGEGKGKTSAAIGLAIRFAGSGGHVLFCQFLKGENTGERQILKNIPEIAVPKLPEEVQFFKAMTEKEKQEMTIYYRKQWRHYQNILKIENYGLLILDEMLPAIQHGIFSEEEIIEFLMNRQKRLEVVLTGRYATKGLLKMADYVSEIRKEKHPYDQGIAARRGIEF